MATHSSVLAYKIPWTEEPVSYSPWDGKESDMIERLTLCLSFAYSSFLIFIILQSNVAHGTRASDSKNQASSH